MTHPHWSRVREVFELALDTPPPQRADLIARECGENDDVRRTVEALLHEHDHRGPLDGERPRLLQNMQEDLFGSNSLRIGEMVAGRYRIERLLGTGGMGEVFEVVDERLDIRVALKTIRDDLTHDPKSLERFRSELLNARKITHPNVCRVFDIGTTQRRTGSTPVWFYTMELLDGETLAQRINRAGQLPVKETLEIARQVASGLDAVHKEGVVHRDLKSANVFLTESNGEICAKLTDFGLARSSTPDKVSHDHSTLVIGTPAYMAPEQLEGARATTASDVYAFGLILFEMITGRRAFDAATPFAVAVKRLKEKPESPTHAVSGLPGVWDEVILRCLDTDPKKRFATACEAVEALEGGGRGFARSRFWVRRLAAAAAIASLLAVAFLLWNRPGEGYKPKAEAGAWYARGLTALREGDLIASQKALESAVATDPEYYLAEARLAEVLLERDSIDAARDHMLRAMATHGRLLPGSKPDQTQMEAIHFTVLRDDEAALPHFERLASEADESRRDNAILDLARSYERANRTQAALAQYRKLEAKDASDGTVQLRLGILLTRMRQAEPAVAAFVKAEDYYQVAGRYNALMETLYRHAVAIRRLGQPQKAEPLLDRAMEIAMLTQSDRHRCLLLLEKGIVARLANDAVQAKAYVASALEIASTQEMEATALNALIDLANVSLDQQEIDEAKTLLERALRVAGLQKNRRGEARALSSLASVAMQRHDGAEAIAYAEQALRFYRSGSYQLETDNLLNIIAAARELNGDRKGALELRQEQLRASKPAGGDRAAMAHFRVGNSLRNLERYPESLVHYREALKTENSRDRAFVRKAMAEALWRLGHYQQARDELKAVAGEKAASEWIRARADVARLMVDISAGRPGAMRSLPPAVERDDPEILAATCYAAVESKSRNLSICDVALKAAELIRHQDLARSVRLMLVEGKAQNSANPATLAASRQLQQEFDAAGQAESALRACFAIVSASPANAKAVEAGRCEARLGILRQNWGEETMRSYLSRPDMQIRVSNLEIYSKSATR